jgi:S-disulfanyl-L-cysteine oxidoreductase SoxD
MTHRFLPALILVAAACAKPSGPPPTNPPQGDGSDTPAAGDEELEGPFDVQATRGGELYGAHCAKCHGASGEGGTAPAVVGQGALSRFADAAEVFTFVSEKMPGDAPGTLPEDDVLAILAFDLKANGVQPDEALSKDNAGEIRLGK